MKTTWTRLIWGFVACVMLFWNVQIVEAASTKNTTGTCEYDKAYEVLEIVNEKRVASGMEALTMDKDLLKAAMLRAAETTVSFNHVRPNGKVCFTACSGKMYAENIAYGYSSASAVMSAWMGSSGHKKNILNSDYQTIGIGCFKKDGVRYWVQCFGYDDLKKVSQPSNVKRTYKVSLTSSKETTIVSSNPLATKVSNFKATAGNKKVYLKWKKKSGISGYQLQVSTGKTFKNRQTYTIGKSTVKKTITKYKGKKLKSGKKYYFRIRAYKKSTASDGTVTKKYSKWKTIYKTVK